MGPQVARALKRCSHLKSLSIECSTGKEVAEELSAADFRVLLGLLELDIGACNAGPIFKLSVTPRCNR